ncbi:MAG TPA: hypothetical protein VIS05_12710 [Ilumatobacter sp.]
MNGNRGPIAPVMVLALVAAVAGQAVVGCSDAPAASPAPSVAPGPVEPGPVEPGPVEPGPVELGVVPEPLSNQPPPPPPPTTAAPTTTIAVELEPIEAPIAGAAASNRLLMIGDAVLAASAPRNDDAMCDELAGLGWVVAIDAEPGRFVDFGRRVLEARMPPAEPADWGAAAVMLGNMFDGDLEAYTDELRSVLDRLAPRPTIVFTISEVSDETAEINAVIRALPRSRPQVVVADWAAVSAENPDRFLRDGGFVPTSRGVDRLVALAAEVLGEVAPSDRGECLPSLFTDDSAIVL